uniref:Uncharacterized protein n=1 Tax=Dulem virus 214 TaxID=3145691 RepID=A0AAU8AVC7_9VIRU
MDYRSIFIVRPLDAEEKEYVITIGNHLATEKRFKTKADARRCIDDKNWDLIASLIFACHDMIEAAKEEGFKQTETNNEEEV